MTPAEYRALRESLGLTQRQLGALVDRDQVTISRRETGKQAIDQEAAMALRLVAMEGGATS